MNGSLLHIKRTPGTDFWNEKVANDECSLVDSPGSLSLGEFGELGDLDGAEHRVSSGGAPQETQMLCIPAGLWMYSATTERVREIEL